MNRRIEDPFKPLQNIPRKTPISQGVEDMQKIINSWNSQPNPPQVYILGYRIHHGLVSALIGLYGLYKGDGYLVGAGLAGVADDIGDADHWLDFEKGGNPNSLIDVV